MLLNTTTSLGADDEADEGIILQDWCDDDDGKRYMLPWDPIVSLSADFIDDSDS